MTATRPLVTLLIPMKNEARYIRGCLESVFAQDYPVLEIIVLDGLSTDDSAAIVAEMIAGRGDSRLLPNPRVIQSAAWNLGIQASRGEIVGIVSAHSELAPDYVSRLVETLERTGADLAGGPTVAVADGLLSRAIALAINSPFGAGNARFHYTTTEIEVDTVFMGACRREVYRRLGGFDEELVRNQDDEFSYRLRKAGGRIVCNPAIRSRYFSRGSLRGLALQYFQYGKWKVRVMQKHRRQMQWRQFIPIALLLALAGSAAWAAFAPAGRTAFAVVAGTYLTGVVFAALLQARRSGFRFFLPLLAVYPILHLSYGLGMLTGLFRFWNRWGDRLGSIPSWEEIAGRLAQAEVPQAMEHG